MTRRRQLALPLTDWTRHKQSDNAHVRTGRNGLETASPAIRAVMFRTHWYTHLRHTHHLQLLPQFLNVNVTWTSRKSHLPASCIVRLSIRQPQVGRGTGRPPSSSQSPNPCSGLGVGRHARTTSFFSFFSLQIAEPPKAIQFRRRLLSTFRLLFGPEV